MIVTGCFELCDIVIVLVLLALSVNLLALNQSEAVLILLFVISDKVCADISLVIMVVSSTKSRVPSI